MALTPRLFDPPPKRAAIVKSVCRFADAPVLNRALAGVHS
jgi:hypothetical protein